MTVGGIEAVISADTRPLKEGEKDVDRVFENLASSYQDLRSTLDRQLELGTLDGAGAARQELAALEQGLDQVARQHEISVDAEGVTAMQNRVEELRAELAQMDDGMRGAGRATGNFNEILYSAGDTLQDAQYGMRGAGNNLAFMAEQIAQASQRTGGFKNTLTGLLGALAGTGGIIFAVQALIVMGPKLISFFASSSEEAGAMADKMKEVAADLVDLQAEIDSLTFSVTGEASIREYAANLEEATQEQQAFAEALQQGSAEDFGESLMDAVRSIGTESTFIERRNALVRELGVTEKVATGALRGRLQFQKKVAQAVKDSSISIDQEVRTLKGLQAESEAAQNKLAALTVTQEAAEAAMAAGAQSAKDYAKAIAASDEPLRAAREGLKDLAETQSERGFSRIEALTGRVEYLRMALDTLREETTVQMDSEAVERLRSRYESAQQALDKLKKSLDNTDPGGPFEAGVAALEKYHQEIVDVQEELGKLPGTLKLVDLNLDAQLDLTADSIDEIERRIRDFREEIGQVEGEGAEANAERRRIQGEIEALKEKKRQMEKNAGIRGEMAEEADRYGRIAEAAIRGVSESIAESTLELVGLNEQLELGEGFFAELGEVGLNALQAIVAELIRAQLEAAGLGQAIDTLASGGDGGGGLLDGLFGGIADYFGGAQVGGGQIDTRGGYPGPGGLSRAGMASAALPSVPSAAALSRALPSVPTGAGRPSISGRAGMKVEVTLAQPRWDGRRFVQDLDEVRWEMENLGP